VRRLQHCENFLFHEATFLGLLDENLFCLTPGTFSVALGFPFDFFIRG
jgi:hypothetical protein